MTSWYAIDAEADEPDAAETEARERVRRDWQGLTLSMVNLSVIAMILDVAREQVIAYGPTIPEGDDPPTRFVYAQIQQAQNLWSAGRVEPGGEIGDEGSFAYRPVPLDWVVKAIIRPIDGKPDAY